MKTNPTQSITTKLGGLTKMSLVIGGIPISTIQSGATVGNIPPWRRYRVRDAVERLGIKLNRAERKALES